MIEIKTTYLTKHAYLTLNANDPHSQVPLTISGDTQAARDIRSHLRFAKGIFGHFINQESVSFSDLLSALDDYPFEYEVTAPPTEKGLPPRFPKNATS